MAKLFGSGTNKRVTGKAADSGYHAKKSTTPTLQAKLPTLQDLFRSGTSGTGRQVTGKAADSGYTTAKKQASQVANRQAVKNWLNHEQEKIAQDNSTTRAYTAKLTGGANIDNSTEVMKSLQRTFGGANDSARTQYNRTLQSKLGYGRNWSNPRSAVGNAIESGVAGTAAGYLNALGTALKSDRRSGLAVDSGKVEAEATGKEWYNRAGNYLQKEADWARMLSENAYLRGSRNLNNAQKLLFDAGIAGTQMMGDFALGMGSGATIPMAIRSFGSGAMEARQAGASENQQILYGAANAAVEAATEKIFDGVARIHGKGMADDMVDDFAKRWAKSEGGQALLRGAAGMGGEGLEEVVSALANPALKTIYNGKSLRENYSDLNLNDVAYEGMIGALMGSIGGSVNIAQAGRGNTQNYQQGNSRAFGGQMRNTNPADTLRNANLNTLYTAAESNTQRSKPYAAAYTTSVQQQRSTPYTTNIGTAGHSQTVSYADAFRQMQAEQNMSADSEYAHYKELERKYLNGNIKAEEFEELRILDNIWGQFDAEAKENGTSLNDRYRKLEQKFRNGNINEQEWNEMIRLENTLKRSDAPSKRTGTDGASEYARYKELEHKFVDGNINEREWNELLKLENVWGQFDVTRKHSNSELKAMRRESIGNRVAAVERYSKPAIIRIQNADLPNGLPIKGGAKTTVDKVDNSGVVLQRRIYGANGMAMKDFDTSDHNLPSAHPMGAHKHEFNYSKKKPRGAPLPLTEEELKEHGDIIKRGENYHDQK